MDLYVVHERNDGVIYNTVMYFKRSIILMATLCVIFKTDLLFGQIKTQGAVGAVTLDGKVWNQLAIRPVIPLGKFGLALDLVFYFDEKGKLHKEEWDFSSGKAIKNTLIDKVYYIRYGFPGDPVYGKVGAMDQVDLGYGILVNGYSNSMLHPQVRKVGMELEFNSRNVFFESFINDFKENIGLFGGRVGTRKFMGIPISFSLVVDRNQFLGLKDRDGDGRPDIVDDFPDNDKWWVDTDGDGWADNDPKELDIDGDGITDTLDSNIPGWNGGVLVLDKDIRRKDDPLNIKRDIDPLYAIAIDVGFPLIGEDRFSVSLYAQAAKLIGKTPHPSGDKAITLGLGLVPFGIATRFGVARFIFEYRMIPQGQFEFSYWNRSYEIERVTFVANASNQLNLITKESRLGRFGKQKGYFARFSLDIGSTLEAVASYQNMLGEMWNVKEVRYIQSQNQNFLTYLRLRKPISKLHHARAFYEQRNVVNPFKFSPTESTLMGWQLGISLGGGLVINYTFRRTFRDINGDGIIRGPGEKNDITTIETSFSF